MKNIIQGLLITASIIGSEVYASQPQRPTTPAPMRSSDELKKDNSICPDELNMEQLREIQKGPIKLGKFEFKLTTPQDQFDKMLPSKLRPISGYKSLAKIEKSVGGRAIISTPEGRVLTCHYTFRTAVGSKLEAEHKVFAITSEPTEVTNEPKGLAEAIVNAPEREQAR